MKTKCPADVIWVQYDTKMAMYWLGDVGKNNKLEARKIGSQSQLCHSSCCMNSSRPQNSSVKWGSGTSWSSKSFLAPVNRDCVIWGLLKQAQTLYFGPWLKTNPSPTLRKITCQCHTFAWNHISLGDHGLLIFYISNAQRSWHLSEDTPPTLAIHLSIRGDIQCQVIMPVAHLIPTYHGPRPLVVCVFFFN